MNLSFDNIKKEPLSVAISNKDFSALWYVNKDQIDICKDCEFRYVCTDCRVYIENHNNKKLSKPSKCKYNPYTATWG
jgi:radical SAM protein with 4Fe4S-binding SPASM domain